MCNISVQQGLEPIVCQQTKGAYSNSCNRLTTGCLVISQYIYIYIYILICQNSSIWESLDALADFAPGAGCEGGPVAATTGDTRGRGPEWEQWWRWAETRLKRYEQNLKTCRKLEVWRNKSCSARPGHVQEDLPGMERTFEIAREPNTWSVPRKEVGTLGHTFSHSSISVRPFATLTALL